MAKSEHIQPAISCSKLKRQADEQNRVIRNSMISMSRTSLAPHPDVRLTCSERKFAAVEAASEKMLKDSVIFRDSVQGQSSLLYRMPDQADEKAF
jgi:hypothetical protein